MWKGRTGLAPPLQRLQVHNSAPYCISVVQWPCLIVHALLHGPFLDTHIATLVKLREAMMAISFWCVNCGAAQSGMLQGN